MLDEMNPVDDIVVPCYTLEICEQSNEPQQYSDGNALESVNMPKLSRPRTGEITGILIKILIAMPAATAKAACR